MEKMVIKLDNPADTIKVQKVLIELMQDLSSGIAYDCEIKRHREKRSLNQNAYAWELITQIADELRKSKEDVYFEMLKDYGQSQVISVLTGVDIGGYFKYYEKFGTGVVNGKEFTHYKIYKGSSEFDTKEFSIFLDGIIQECHNLNIPTLSQEEIDRLYTRFRS